MEVPIEAERLTSADAGTQLNRDHGAHKSESLPKSPDQPPRSDYWILGSLLSVVSLAALWFFYSRNEILLSGDAVAHINIARRVFDSRTPGPLQLGSVWLPLPHLLTIPFVISEGMWQTGLGGSVISVMSYVVAGLGLFRLLSRWSRIAAWIGGLCFALNPNLLYVQTTALNEPLYLAAFLWAIVFFADAWDSLRGGSAPPSGSLAKGAIGLTAAIFTRYDGWFLAAICWLAISPALIAAIREMAQPKARQLRKAVSKALVLTAVGPALWLGYNLGVYGNALEFANGPYSAKAIAERTTDKTAPPYPGEHHPWTAGVYFAKAAQLNMGDGRIARIVVWVAAILSFLIALRWHWFPIALLWAPLLFYSLSIAYGSVPIFIPVWWPFSYYNVRYGLQLLPAIAVGIALLAVLIGRISAPAIRISALFVLLAAIAIVYVSSWRTTPICLREVRANGDARLQLDSRLAELLDRIPPKSTVLAYTGSHSGAFELAGFPLRQTINEGNEFAWDLSLLNPALTADYVIASDDDSVATAVQRHPTGLIAISKLTVAGQPGITVYKSLARRKPPSRDSNRLNRNETLD